VRGAHQGPVSITFATLDSSAQHFSPTIECQLYIQVTIERLIGDVVAFYDVVIGIRFIIGLKVREWWQVIYNLYDQ
jgi:hypothetical protein